MKHFNLVAVLPLLLYTVECRAASIDFEGLSDLEVVTNQYPGIAFANTITLTAGISLNEFDFPPRSGVNVVSDDGGPIEILFSVPMLSFSGYFTYVVPLSLEAFDPGNVSVALVSSLFSANDGFSGEPGSSPDELIQVNYAGGISRVLITADVFGASFTMDDISYTQSAVPEPKTGYLVLLASLGLVTLRGVKKQLRKSSCAK